MLGQQTWRLAIYLPIQQVYELRWAGVGDISTILYH